MSDDDFEYEIPFNPIVDLRDRQSLFAVIAALAAGTVLGINLAMGMAAPPGGAVIALPDWFGDAEWVMWMAALVSLMAMLGWLSTDRTRLKEAEYDE